MEDPVIFVICKLKYSPGILITDKKLSKVERFSFT